MNPLFEPGWWKRPEVVTGLTLVMLQTAINQPSFLKQGTPAFSIVAYICSVLVALGVTSSLFTARKKKEEDSPAQAQRIAELEAKLESKAPSTAPPAP